MNYKTLKILLLLLLPFALVAQKIDILIPGFINEENNKTDFKVKELAITRFPMCDTIYKNPYISATYTYNENGYLIKEIKNNKEGNEVLRIDIVYNSLNSYSHITQIKHYDYTIELTKFKYDKLGRLRKVTGRVTDLKAIKKSISIAYFYHRKNKACTVSIRINSEPASKIVVEYNKNNNVLAIKSDDKITQSAIFDSENRLMETRYYNDSFTTSIFYTHDDSKFITEAQGYINGIHCFRTRFAYFFYR